MLNSALEHKHNFLAVIAYSFRGEFEENEDEKAELDVETEEDEGDEYNGESDEGECNKSTIIIKIGIGTHLCVEVYMSL
ncbi:hypothetical protein EGR_11252 [Echinococcus granulosus]|uniref:Uncharacterized protein n=1 Tax=Echinococcus granulosus TaxID=6210 RepID=W6UK55_ECHGR|nr:hypothetical protein EGR_11252 [Echinococcus granulosus]EUB53894.1 hypothetical protein EGR_11252 [Echinococcus granulosus]